MSKKNATSAMTIAGFLILSLNCFSSAAFAETNDSMAENGKSPLQIVN